MAASARRTDNGFSMIELLVVIVVLGILAAIVVSAVTGVADDAQQTSCIADVRVIDKAEQLFETDNTAFGTETQLVDAGYLHSPSVLHDVAISPGGYAVVATNSCLGGASATSSSSPSVTTSTTAAPTTTVSSTTSTPPTSTSPPTTVPVATALSMSSVTSSVVAGAVFAPITVTVYDASGNVVTSSSAPITISLSSNPGGATLSGTATVSAVGGVATFNDLSVDKSASGYTFAASSAGLVDSVSAAFAVGAAAASQFAVVQQPTAGITATAFATQPVVALSDAFGNPVTTSTAAVTLSIVVGSGTAGAVLSCTSNPVAAVAGVATFAGCKINVAGSGYQLRASATGMTAATLGAFSVSGPATKLAFSVQPTSSIANAPMAPDVTVTVQDASGRTVTASNGSITLTPSTAGILVGSPVSNAVNGVATFPGLSINKVGNSYKLTASSPGLTSIASNAFNATIGAASRLVFTGQPSGATVGVAWTSQPKVTILDAYGNTVTSSVASVTLAITPGTGTSGSALTCTANPKAAVSGIVTFAGCKIDTLGSGYTLTASSAGVTDAVSAAFDNPFGPVTKLVFITQPTSVVAGSSVSPSVTVAAEDALSRIVTTSNATITITISTNPGGGTLSGTASAAVVNGVATFTNLSINKTGTGYRLTATSSSLSVISSTFNVTAGPASQLAFTTQPGGGAVNTVWAIQPKVTVLDALGNTVTTSTASIGLSITAGTGTSGALLTCTANPKAAALGIATFAGCKISKTGAGYTLTASSSGLGSAVSSSVTIT
jgi:prepilin-type N-terminal cleavage/methylation domain-containing protein